MISNGLAQKVTIVITAASTITAAMVAKTQGEMHYLRYWRFPYYYPIFKQY